METDYQPLISVIIPTYKRAEYLLRAIRSVINQTYANIEIIVVDDNNGDDEYRRDTKTIIQVEFFKKPIIYIEHPYNKGLPAARNSGIKIAKGEFIAFLDDDDEWLPQKLEKQINLFKNLPENYGVISCGWNLIHVVNQYEKKVYPNYRGDLSQKLALNHFSPPSMILVRKHFLTLINGFDEDFRWRQDVELYYRLSPHCLFDFVDECLVNYYYHSASMSRNYDQKLRAVIQFIDKHKVKLKKNKLPWSEINERKGDLAAACGKWFTALNSFFIAIINRPSRFEILVKLFLSFFGSRIYKRIRKF